jgi:hypothetical protein
MAEARHLPTFRENEERLAVLADACHDLNQRFAGALSAARNQGERPAACDIRIGDKVFATFGVIDATYFWTFDGGESCHYAKNKDVMRRLLTFEIAAALNRTGKSR